MGIDRNSTKNAILKSPNTANDIAAVDSVHLKTMIEVAIISRISAASRSGGNIQIIVS